MDLLSNTSWISTVDILGAAQGFFLAMLLVGRGVNRVANRYLALLMVAFSVDLLTAAYYLEGYDQVWPHFIGVDVSTGMLYGPLLYLYAHSLGHGGRVPARRDLRHLIPFLVVVAALLPFHLQPADLKLAYRADPAASEWASFFNAVGYFKLFYSFGYLLGVVGLLKRHRRLVRTEYSTIDRVNLTWLTRLLYGGLVVWAIAAVAQLRWSWAGTGRDPMEGFGGYVSVASAIFVYSIGYLGLRQPAIFMGAAEDSDRMPTIHDGSMVIIDEATGAPDLADREDAKPSYTRSGLSDENRERIYNQLVAVMEERHPFRDPGLTLKQLADLSGLTPHHVSEAINTSAGQNFYEFVNAYRVEDVKNRLLDPDMDAFTVLALGMESGFNSKSTFNAIFKKHTGMTPSAYRRRER